MKIVKSGEGLEIKTPPEFKAEKIFSNKKTEIIRIEFIEKGFFKKHYAPVDIWIYVLEGEGIAEGEREKIKISKDDMLFSPAGNPHKIINTGKGSLRILIIKIPSSEKPVVFVE
jgi:quercetin dioxygenase-like cupin family protein